MPNSAASVRAVFEVGDAVTAGGGVIVGYSVSGGVATLDMPAAKVSEIIAAATGAVAALDITRVTTATTVTMPRAALTQLVNANLGLELRMPQGTMNLNRVAAQSAANQAAGLNISATLNNVGHGSLTAAQQSAVKAGDVVFNISIMSGTQAIRNFDGTITITVPYTGQTPVAVWRLADGGVLERINSTHNATARTVTFTTNRLSFFVVGRDGVAPPPPTDNPFTDVRAGDWFYNSVMYVYRNNLMGATSTTRCGSRRTRA
jgi:hypothetical protein